jgi:hypothetical protein
MDTGTPGGFSPFILKQIKQLLKYGKIETSNII